MERGLDEVRGRTITTKDRMDTKEKTLPVFSLVSFVSFVVNRFGIVKSSGAYGVPILYSFLYPRK
jgi:hypothetical protein